VPGPARAVVGGPVFADGLWWWNIDFGNGADGWALEIELVTYTIPTQNLVAHWAFDEGIGITALDSSGNGPNWLAGQTGGALDLDGVDDFLDADSPMALDDMGTKTVAAWIKRKDIANSQFVGLKGYTGVQGGWEFYVRRSTGEASANRLGYNHGWFGSAAGSAIWYGSTDLDLADSWYHVAVAYDAFSSGNIPEMYVNGIKQTVFVEQPAAGLESVDSANKLTLGGTPQESGDMVMNDVYIYDRVLSASEVLRLYYFAAPAYACSDNLDNDNDGVINFPRTRVVRHSRITTNRVAFNPTPLWI
jgi:hypothetical protein